MVTPNGAIGRFEEHRNQTEDRLRTSKEGTSLDVFVPVFRLLNYAPRTILRLQQLPPIPIPPPTNSRLLATVVPTVWSAARTVPRTVVKWREQHRKTHALSEVLPNIIPSRCAVKEGQQPSHHTTTLNPFPYISMCGYIVITIPVVGESGSFPGRIFNGTRTP